MPLAYRFFTWVRGSRDGDRHRWRRVDEAGTGGGVISQVLKGMCRPIFPAPTVFINGHLHCHHQLSTMFMNCAGPEGPGNTIGQVIFNGPMYYAEVGPGGTIPSETNPPPQAESFAEGGCMPKLDKLPGSSLGGLQDIVGLAQQAYNLSKTDWKNPASVLGAIGGLAGMAGLGGFAQAAQMAAGVAGMATADWSNPGAAMGAAMNAAGSMFGSSGRSTGGKPGFGTINGIAGPVAIGGSSSGGSDVKLPPGVTPCF